MENTDSLKHFPLFVEKMERENISPTVIETFKYYYLKAVKGETGLLTDQELTSVCVEEVQDADHLQHYKSIGKKVIKNTVAVILNGGLGTSMGLSGPKSLIKAKNDLSFLEIILQQAKKKLTLALMNSYNTHQDTIDAISKINPPNPPLMFIQNKFPKLLQEGFSPAFWPKDPSLEWNPPGHGDIYTALYSSGLLDRLINNGIVFAFISNSDNLGASMDEALLGYFSENRFPFMMEVSDRTPLDMKGGHLARYKNGRFILRESAQCPQEERNAFSDIHRYCFFNTNNLWINLNALKEYLQKHKTLQLPMILNPKPLDPRNSDSPQVYQIETAMGAAITLFKNASVVKVPRSRFFPVKKCNELLAIRSDYYLLHKENGLILNPNRVSDTLEIILDPLFYGKIDQFERRFPQGVPSLVNCESLRVIGDVCFEKDIKIVGSVTIENQSKKQKVITSGTLIDHDIIL